MCGRFVIFSPYDIIKETFAVDTESPGMTPNYNVCPTMEIPAIIRENQKNALIALHWGLVPFWARDSSVGARMINARVETVTQKPSFRNAFKHRRCLIPADGYYEWKGKKGAKQPYYITLESSAPFAFAGLWEIW